MRRLCAGAKLLIVCVDSREDSVPITALRLVCVRVDSGWSVCAWLLMSRGRTDGARRHLVGGKVSSQCG